MFGCSWLLKRRGFEVLEASNGEDAVSLYEQYKNRIALVTLDWRMPQMSGDLVLNELRRLNPDVQVIVLSGYGGDERADELEQTQTPVLKKPYRLSELTQLIHELTGLEQTAPAQPDDE